MHHAVFPDFLVSRCIIYPTVNMGNGEQQKTPLLTVLCILLRSSVGCRCTFRGSWHQKCISSHDTSPLSPVWVPRENVR